MIDFHAHFNNGEPEKVRAFVANCEKNNCFSVVSGGLRYGGHDYLPNETVIEICKQYPDCFIPLAKLDLWETADPDEVYRYAEMGVRGFKCIYPYYEYDHDIYMPVYEAAEKCNLPLLFHTGNYRPNEMDVRSHVPALRNMHPINLDRIARSFQKLNIIMAHLGTRIYQAEASQYIKMHANLYADLGGCGQWKRMQPELLTSMLSQSIAVVDPEFTYFRKLVLGSDAYVTHPWIITDGQRSYRNLLDRIGVPENIIREVLGGTVAKWLGIELEA